MLISTKFRNFFHGQSGQNGHCNLFLAGNFLVPDHHPMKSTLRIIFLAALFVIAAIIMCIEQQNPFARSLDISLFISLSMRKDAF